jgi:hypothetical protein
MVHGPSTALRLTFEPSELRSFLVKCRRQICTGPAGLSCRVRSRNGLDMVESRDVYAASSPGLGTFHRPGRDIGVIQAELISSVEAKTRAVDNKLDEDNGLTFEDARDSTAKCLVDPANAKPRDRVLTRRLPPLNFIESEHWSFEIAMVSESFSIGAGRICKESRL